MALFSQPAGAQAAPAPDAAATPAQTSGPEQFAAPTSDNRLGDIVVTARYVNESIQDTPIAITAQTSSQLQAANVTNISTLGAVVPNLFTMPGDSQGAGTPVIALRGVVQGANSSSSLAVPPAVAIYTDDIYHGTTAGSELDFTDIARVEVNRGPQSTLSGNASPAGSIRLYTVDPKGDGSGYLQLQAGSFRRMGISGALDLGLTDTLAIRASGSIERERGFARRLDFTCQMNKQGTPQLAGRLPQFQPDSAGKDCIIGRLGGGTTAVGQVKIRWQPTDTLDILLTGRHREEDLEETPEVALAYRTACSVAVAANPAAGINATPAIGPQPCTATAGAQAYHRAAVRTFGVTTGPQFVTPERSGGIYDTYATNCRPLLDLSGGGFPANYPTNFCYDQGKTARHSLLSAKVRAELADNVALTAIGGYTNYRNEFTQNGDQSPLGHVLTHFINRNEQYSAELRFNGKLFDDKLEWVVGGFALKMDGYQNNSVSFVNINQLTQVHGINKSRSAFFHLDYNLTDRWRVSGGARYSDTEIAITILNPSAVSVLVPVKSTTTRPDWLISTDYQVTDDILVYASASSGSRPAGLTTILSTPRQLQATSEEDLISYETGVKADLFDRRLRTNLTAFYLDYRKLAVSALGTECRNQPGPVATYFSVAQNSPGAITACSQFPGTPDPVTFSQNVGIPATVKGFEWDITAVPVDGLRIGWTGGFNDYTSGVKEVGRPGYLFPGNLRQPRWNQHADISYDIETSIGIFTPRVDWQWQSKQTYDTTPQSRAPLPELIIQPYSLFNAQVSYAAPDKAWSATLAVTNLADKWFHYQVLSGVINDQTRVGEPRKLLFTVRKTF
jgi:iron complex outermembrane receptor protein